MRDRSSRLTRALMVAGASLFILVGAVFGTNALTSTGRGTDPAVTSQTPAASSPAEPAETSEPAGEPQQPAATNADGDGQNPSDSDGEGPETGSD